MLRNPIFCIFSVCVCGGGGGGGGVRTLCPVPSGSAQALHHDAVCCSKVCDYGTSCFLMLKGDVLMKPKPPSLDDQSNGDHSKADSCFKLEETERKLYV